MARIYGAQKALSNHPCTFLINLENQLHQELVAVLDQERDLWMLKSRINWMVQRDRNTSFYHVSALARRKRNHIASIKDEGVPGLQRKEVSWSILGGVSFPYIPRLMWKPCGARIMMSTGKCISLMRTGIPLVP